MAATLEMSIVKGNSFSVKDLLDLPEPKAGVVPCTSPPGGDGSIDLSATRIPRAADISAVSHFYDTSDNPYTRWLQTNDHMQYGRK